MDAQTALQTRRSYALLEAPATTDGWGEQPSERSEDARAAQFNVGLDLVLRSATT